MKIGKVFNHNDSSKIKKSKAFFVRKITSENSIELINLIDREILGLTL
jgi:hypothetical protein